MSKIFPNFFNELEAFIIYFWLILNLKIFMSRPNSNTASTEYVFQQTVTYHCDYGYVTSVGETEFNLYCNSQAEYEYSSEVKNEDYGCKRISCGMSPQVEHSASYYQPTELLYGVRFFFIISVL